MEKSALSAGSSLACLEYEGFAVEDVELATHKLNGLTQHRIGLVVTVRLQQCGHDVHKSTKGTANAQETQTYIILVLNFTIPYMWKF